MSYWNRRYYLRPNLYSFLFLEETICIKPFKVEKYISKESHFSASKITLFLTLSMFWGWMTLTLSIYGRFPDLFFLFHLCVYLHTSSLMLRLSFLRERVFICLRFLLFSYSKVSIWHHLTSILLNIRFLMMNTLLISWKRFLYTCFEWIKASFVSDVFSVRKWDFS